MKTEEKPAEVWPSTDVLVAEITAFVRHANSQCECPNFGECVVTQGKIVETWVSRVPNKKEWEKVAQ